MRRRSESTLARLAAERMVSDEDSHKKIVPRAVRNGLPDFKPYVYRGTGADQCAETAQRSGPRPGAAP